MSTATKVKPRSNVAIKIFVNPNISNSGLENYGQALFDGAVQSDELFVKEVTSPIGIPGSPYYKPGIYRAVNGLDETAPEINKLPEEERKAAIKDIRETVSQLQYLMFGGDKIDIKDKEFWSKCEKLAPTSDYWKNNESYENGGFKLELSDAGLYLDMERPLDIMIERAVKAGGYRSLVAPSIEAAYNWPYPSPPKFYLDKLENTAAINTEVRKLVNKAKAKLDDLRDTNIDRLAVIMRNFDPDATAYKKSTPADVMYITADKAIDGELWERNKRQAAQRFLDICSMDPEDLHINSIIKCASKYMFISNKKDTTGDQQIYFLEDMIALGRNHAEVALYLKNPLNQDILFKIKAKVENEINQ